MTKAEPTALAPPPLGPPAPLWAAWWAPLAAAWWTAALGAWTGAAASAPSRAWSAPWSAPWIGGDAAPALTFSPAITLSPVFAPTIAPVWRPTNQLDVDPVTHWTLSRRFGFAAGDPRGDAFIARYEEQQALIRLLCAEDPNTEDPSAETASAARPRAEPLSAPLRRRIAALSAEMATLRQNAGLA